MHAAVLTFPGHFFQTLLLIRSIRQHYPEVIGISFLLDDVACQSWPEYARDFETQVRSLIDIDCEFYLGTRLESIRTCVSGWWRQQLIKCTLDQILPGQEWFVVDGDTLFDTRCDVRHRVPISKVYNEHTHYAIMCRNYVRTLLGTEQGTLLCDDVPVLTNPIPFRYLEADFLRALRRHVESRFDQDFVSLHLDCFQDQRIVAFVDPPDRMTMSEWELMECYRRYIRKDMWPLVDIGSGYRTDIEDGAITQTENIFRHAYRRDSEIGQAWFQDRGLHIPSQIWQRSLAWYEHQKSDRPL